MAKSNVEKKKWVNERVTTKYWVEKKRLGVELFYENGKLRDITYGAMNDNILWANTIHAHLLAGLLGNIKDKSIVNAIVAKEMKIVKEQEGYRKSEVDRMEKMIQGHKKELILCEERTKMLEEFSHKPEAKPRKAKRRLKKGGLMTIEADRKAQKKRDERMREKKLKEAVKDASKKR
jgi:hypothetical protein